MGTHFNQREAGTGSGELQVQAKFRRAVALHQGGRLAEAKAQYEEILRTHPEHPDALHFLGIVAYQSNDHRRAAELINKAIRILPGNAAFYYNLGNAQVRLEQFAAAVQSFEKAIELQPDYAKAFCNRGSALVALNQLEAAEASFGQALALQPGYTEAHLNRGLVLARLNRTDAAIESFQDAIKLNPNHVDAHLSLGTALLELGRHALAVKSYERAVQLNPDGATGHFNLGIAYMAGKNPSTAVAAYEHAIRLKPDYAEAHYSLGIALAELNRLDAAVASYANALRFNSNYPEALSNCANVLLRQRRFDAAIASCESAIRLRPEFAEAHYNLGLALEELGRFDRAAVSFEKAVSLKPNFDFVLGDWLFARMRMCDWRDYDAGIAGIKSRIERGEKVLSPFVVLAMADSSPLQKRAAQIWTETKYPACADLGPIARRTNRKRLRIGYYSADFHNHATAYLMAELFESHDRSAFEIFAFSFGPDLNDAMRSRLSKSFDRFIDVRAMTDLEVARLSRQLEVDIAVDLKGLTQDSRCGIFAARSAPVQVNYLGYPGTTGADYIDYLIADETVVPQDHASDFTEKVVYLPDCYQPNDSKRGMSELDHTRADFGLPAAGFVFCCFNNNYKITPVTFAGWMRLLQEVDGSVLWLLEDNALASANLRKEAERRGVDAARLLFARRVPLAEHLARHRLADLFVDTLPYNAHTTASDALWAGLPVLTCLGHSFPGRVAASLLKAVGLPELIARTQAEYERMAIGLARNPERLAILREKLSRNRLTAPLFDTPRYARHIESAYLRMHELYQAGSTPEHFRVSSVP